MTAAREARDRGLDERASPAPLLQTWGWGDVHSHAGWPVERVRLPPGATGSVHLRGRGLLREAALPAGPAAGSPGACCWAVCDGAAPTAAVIRRRVRRFRRCSSHGTPAAPTTCSRDGAALIPS